MCFSMSSISQWFVNESKNNNLTLNFSSNWSIIYLFILYYKGPLEEQLIVDDTIILVTKVISVQNLAHGHI